MYVTAEIVGISIPVALLVQVHRKRTMYEPCIHQPSVGEELRLHPHIVHTFLSFMDHAK